MTNVIDVGDTHRHVERAKARLRGRRAQLLGFEAVEIQRFVTASSRPITMQGASEALKDFDETNNRRPETIFAGGARGVMLVADDELSARIDELDASFRKHTAGLTLAVAHVPFDAANENEEEYALQWLWLKQRSAHDACAPESINLAAFERPSCADCRARPGEHKSPKPDSPEEMICSRCDKLIKRGSKSQYARMEKWTLEDVSEEGLLGVVSADGNKLGQFFRSLKSLVALRAGSLAVNNIFDAAHHAALDRLPDPDDQRHIAPITGGDDIKVFLFPTAALDYVDALMQAVEKNAASVARENGVLTNESRKLLENLGVGVGLVIAPYYIPATRLVDLAHDLEDDAKRYVKKNGNCRSAVCFSVHRVDGEPDKNARQTVGAPAWTETIRRARFLRRDVPSGQRAAAAAAWDLDESERQNQHLYQVARSWAWRNWFDLCGVKWDQRDAALELLNNKGLLALAGLGGHRGKKEA